VDDLTRALALAEKFNKASHLTDVPFKDLEELSKLAFKLEDEGNGEAAENILAALFGLSPDKLSNPSEAEGTRAVMWMAILVSALNDEESVSIANYKELFDSLAEQGEDIFQEIEEIDPVFARYLGVTPPKP